MSANGFIPEMLSYKLKNTLTMLSFASFFTS